MIVARICMPGTKELFPGSCDIKGYYHGGWFPVESFQFDCKSKGGTEKAKPTGSAPTRSGSAGSRLASSGSSGSDEDKGSEMSLAKQVEMASCYLMELALKERSHKQGVDPELKLHADIHVLGSVAIKDGTTVVKNIYPSVMIHLEGVKVKGWGISGSANGRPSENLTLWYDRSAMHYVWTGDGVSFQAFGPTGWDQYANAQWRPAESDCKWKDFLPPNCGL